MGAKSAQGRSRNEALEGCQIIQKLQIERDSLQKEVERLKGAMQTALKKCWCVEDRDAGVAVCKICGIIKDGLASQGAGRLDK